MASTRYHVLFIQGGGSNEDYNADAKLVATLREALGKAYVIHYPLLPEESAPDFGRLKQIGQEISLINGEIILVGHSLGASMLLKYLSENKIKKKDRRNFSHLYTILERPRRLEARSKTGQKFS